MDYNIDLYIGAPGSGKTTLAVYLALKELRKNRFRKSPRNVLSNVAISGVSLFDAKTHFGKYDLSNSLCICDESGLEYDNRNFSTNFKGLDGLDTLRFFKLHRHYKTDLVFLSQGLDIDLKIRTLAKRIFIVKKCTLIPCLTRVRRVSKRIGIDEVTKQLIDEYYFVPLSSKYIFRPKYYKYFDSFEAPELPKMDFDKIPPYKKPRRELKLNNLLTNSHTLESFALYREELGSRFNYTFFYYTILKCIC